MEPSNNSFTLQDLQAKYEEVDQKNDRYNEYFNQKFEQARKEREEWSRNFNKAMEKSRKEQDEFNREFNAKLAHSRKEQDQFNREFNEKIEKSREEREKWSRKIKKEVKRSRRERKKRMKEHEKRMKEHEIRMKEHEERVKENDRIIRENDRLIRETNRQIGFYGNTQGEIAEDLFRRNIKSLLDTLGVHIDRVETNKKGKEGREFDILAVNNKDIYVFEIKNKIRDEDIDIFLEEQLPSFRENFPEYADLTLYGGMGSLVVKEPLENRVLKQGLFLLTQNDGTAKLTKPDHPRPLIL